MGRIGDVAGALTGSTSVRTSASCSTRMNANRASSSATRATETLWPRRLHPTPSGLQFQWAAKPSSLPRVVFLHRTVPLVQKVCVHYVISGLPTQSGPAFRPEARARLRSFRS